MFVVRNAAVDITVIHQACRRDLGAVEYFMVNDMFEARKDSPYEIVHAEWAVHVSFKSRPALGDAVQRHALRVDGDIHQESRLDVLFGLLDQRHFARNRDSAAIPRPFHGGPPHRLGKHVVA